MATFNNPFPNSAAAYQQASQNSMFGAPAMNVNQSWGNLQNSGGMSLQEFIKQGQPAMNVNQTWGNLPSTPAQMYPVSSSLGNWANQNNLIPNQFQAQQSPVSQPFYEMGTGTGQAIQTSPVAQNTFGSLGNTSSVTGSTQPSFNNPNAFGGQMANALTGMPTSTNAPTGGAFLGMDTADSFDSSTYGMLHNNALANQPQGNFLSGTMFEGMTEGMSNGDLISGIGGIVQGGLGAYGMFAGLDLQKDQLKVSQGNLALNREQYESSRADKETLQKQNREWYS